MKKILSAFAATLAVTAPLAVTTPSWAASEAQQATKCVSKAEYKAVNKRMSLTKVREIFDRQKPSWNFFDPILGGGHQTFQTCGWGDENTVTIFYAKSKVSQKKVGPPEDVTRGAAACVSKLEYGKVAKGMSRMKVGKIVGNRAPSYATNILSQYTACSWTEKYVTIKWTVAGKVKSKALASLAIRTWRAGGKCVTRPEYKSIKPDMTKTKVMTLIQNQSAYDSAGRWTLYVPCQGWTTNFVGIDWTHGKAESKGLVPN